MGFCENMHAYKGKMFASEILKAFVKQESKHKLYTHYDTLMIVARSLFPKLNQRIVLYFSITTSSQ